jgi:hypothetical protein
VLGAGSTVVVADGEPLEVFGHAFAYLLDQTDGKIDLN